MFRVEVLLDKPPFFKGGGGRLHSGATDFSSLNDVLYLLGFIIRYLCNGEMWLNIQ